MSDWDADSADEVAAQTSALKVTAKPVKKWEDEDAEDNEIKDDWDASDDEKPKPVPTGPAPPVRKKGITKLKIAEKEALERAQAEKEAALLAEAQDPLARQRAARERELKADLENARGLFGDDAVEAVAPSADPFEANPITANDFKQVSDQIAEMIISKWGNKALFPKFVEEHVKALCQPLKDLEIRNCSSKLSVLANEKQKAAKDAGGKKKSKTTAKPTLAVGGKTGASRAADVNTYDDFDDDDFM